MITVIYLENNELIVLMSDKLALKYEITNKYPCVESFEKRMPGFLNRGGILCIDVFKL